MKRLIGAITMVAGLAFGNAGDPPARVARLNYLNGSVSFQPAGVQDWTPAAVNYPMSTGDNLWVDANSRAEMHIGSTAIHVDATTAASFLNLDDRTVQMRLSQGSILIRIRYMADDDVYEVDTPNGAISLLRTGSYRIDANPDSQTTTITVRGGEAEVTAGGGAFPIHPRQSGILVAANPLETRPAGPYDMFDNWSMDRERREDSRPSAKYVSRELPGYEDLDDNGTWRPYPGYGMVWYPNVPPGWAPYRYGHWRWIEPWGWTWIDDAAWGFAPFHYGRWAQGGGAWFWVPGPGLGPTPVMVAGGPRPMIVRPVYAPALVAFVGGSNWSVGLGVGGGAGVAWFPLGPREVFVPAYHASPTYVNQVNVVNVTNVTSVANVRYVNQTAPGAVTAVSRADFTSAAPVQRAAFQVPPSAIANAPVAGSAPAIAPTAQSVAPITRGSFVAKPPATATTQTVVTRTPPPPPPVPFAARQSALNANPGRPVDQSTLSRLQQNTPPVSQPAPRATPAAPAAPVTNTGFGRPAITPAQPSTTTQPSSVNRPPSTAVTPSSTQPQPAARPAHSRQEESSEKHPSKKKSKEKDRKEQ